MSHHSPKYVAFLASRMDPDRVALNALRERIVEVGIEVGCPVWAAKIDIQESDGQSAYAVQVACLRKVRQLQEFICIIDGSYGKPWNAAGLCVLELEILTAAVARKPLHFFRFESCDETNLKMDSLLQVIRIAVGTPVDLAPKPADQIVAELRGRLGKKKWAVPKFLHFFCRQKQTLPDLGNLNIHFMDSRFSPLCAGRPDPELISRLLQTAESEDVEAPLRLINVWMAIRHLFGAPYTDRSSTDFLPLWEQALMIWAITSAWYGLHGHLYLGRLAAVNSLLFIRQQQAAVGMVTQHSIQGTLGAIASEYLSISKTVGSRRLRYILLQRARKNVDAALSSGGADPSGLFGVRGTILQNLGLRKDGVRDYKQMLQIRIDAGEDAGRIGEAEVELGFGYLRAWRPILAERLLLRGVRHLEDSDRYPFTVRALRKLAAFYVVTLRPFRARRVLDQAYALATRYELQGQLQQMQRLRGLLRWVPVSLSRSNMRSAC